MYKLTRIDPEWHPEKPHGRSNFPFKTMEVGQAFRIDKGRVKFESIRNHCYVVSKRLNKKFRARLLPCGDIEVGRFA